MSEKSCDKKLTFDSKKQADTAALQAQWERDVKLKSYKCKDCKLWHLASDYQLSYSIADE